MRAPTIASQTTFLAPHRNMIQDHATVSGRYIGAGGGVGLKLHSAATVTYPE